MKTKTTTLLITGIMLVASCVKENTIVKTSNTAEASVAQVSSSDASELTGFNAVRIGTQVWMTKNWTGNTFRNGDLIPQVKNLLKSTSLTTGAWCWYNNDSRLGKLYNYYAIIDLEDWLPKDGTCLVLMNGQSYLNI